MQDGPTVFVVDDDPAVREAVSILIRSTGRNVETYATARAFLEDYDPARPGCLVLDLRMPGMSGLELQDEIVKRAIDIPIIVVTAHGEVGSAVRAMKAGAIDFIEKPYGDQTLLDRIDQAIARDAQLRQQRARRETFGARLSQLTPRDREVMALLIAGKMTKEIAAAFQVSSQAIDSHRRRILEKMEVANVVELTRLVDECGG
jgi:two-component system response regulator FixJ